MRKVNFSRQQEKFNLFNAKARRSYCSYRTLKHYMPIWYIVHTIYIPIRFLQSSLVQPINVKWVWEEEKGPFYLCSILPVLLWKIILIPFFAFSFHSCAVGLWVAGRAGRLGKKMTTLTCACYYCVTTRFFKKKVQWESRSPPPRH